MEGVCDECVGGGWGGQGVFIAQGLGSVPRLCLGRVAGSATTERNAVSIHNVLTQT